MRKIFPSRCPFPSSLCACENHQSGGEGDFLHFLASQRVLLAERAGGWKKGEKPDMLERISRHYLMLTDG
jgi:hypothetical protein